MMGLVLLLALGASLSQAQSTNFFISPGSQEAQLESGNRTDQYPVYSQHDNTLFSWNTNWTTVSLLLWQNENASSIRLFEMQSDAPNTYTYDMNPDVDLTWNDVFFLTLWNENRGTEGGISFFSSSYFRINASDPDSTTTTSTSTRTTSTSTSTSTSTQTATDEPTPTPESADNESVSESASSSSSGLSSSAKVGLGVGIGLGVPALALAAVAAFYYRRRSQATAWQREQATHQYQPAPQFGSDSGGYPPPPLSDISGNANPSPFKIAPVNANTIPGYMGPSEVDGANIGVGVQSRFQELAGR
ncbi:hypothetical protein BJY04DRAFT_180505 [Aspergillus karnatakaensis]|uniref:uncharacterized protein n=1 Tax=Aspergillus karnatakaensis TaxID=1810916 RepID=UPI003CCDD60B